jgi:hypothetical protein
MSKLIIDNNVSMNKCASVCVAMSIHEVLLYLKQINTCNYPTLGVLDHPLFGVARGRCAESQTRCVAMAEGTPTVRAIPARDGNWRVACGPMMQGHRPRIERGDNRSEPIPFVTPSRTRILDASSEIPPSAHVPSRVGLSAVMHKLS